MEHGIDRDGSEERRVLGDDFGVEGCGGGFEEGFAIIEVYFG